MIDSDYEQHIRDYDTELGSDSTMTGVTSDPLTTSTSSRIESSSTSENYYSLSNTDDDNSFEIISRSQWGALEPNKPEELIGLEPPVQYISLSYNSGVEPCRSLEECCERMRTIQQMHADRDLADISYNFLIGADARVYEARGWIDKPDLSLRYPDLINFRIDIAFIGDYRLCPLPMKMLDKAIDLVRHGVRENYVEEDFEFIGLSDVEPRDDYLEFKNRVPPVKERGRGRGRGRRGRGRGAARGRGRVVESVWDPNTGSGLGASTAQGMSNGEGKPRKKHKKVMTVDDLL